MFSGMYFIAATFDPGIIISRAGVAMSKLPLVDAVSSLAGMLEFFIGVALMLSAFSVFERRNSR